MKKLILIILFLLCISMCSHGAQAMNNERLIYAIGSVESGHNAKAVSPGGKYVGWLQIGKGVVDDCNRIVGKRRFTYADRFDKEKSREMFLIIQGYYNPEGDVYKAIRIWNEGPHYNRGIKTTKYVQKVLNVYNTLPDTFLVEKQKSK